MIIPMPIFNEMFNIIFESIFNDNSDTNVIRQIKKQFLMIIPIQMLYDKLRNNF